MRCTSLLAAASIVLVAAQVSADEAMHQHAAGEAQTARAGHVMVNPDQLKWQAGPPGLPTGSEFAVLEGDPTKPGPFTIRAKLPANYKIQPHTHPGDEHVTVLSGSLYMGLGTSFNESTAHELKPGGYAVMYVGTTHFGFTREPAVLQLHGIGPWDIKYVNPADDPRTAQK